jgi:hypothetical protein
MPADAGGGASEASPLPQRRPTSCPRASTSARLPSHDGKLYKRLLKDEYWTSHQSRII